MGPGVTWSELGVVKTVAVDQRALIDKVLARYAGQFDLFRELLQNSDDADSSAVEIHFETSAYRDHVEEKQNMPINLELVSHWTIKNDGKEFNDDDWKRLETIALGNPDPRKIGAFGVGFYVVFSKTDIPFVSSGERAMKFFWSENLLSVDHQTVKRDLWTTFVLPLRDPARVPPLLELMRFLATSITFMVKLQAVQVFCNGALIGRIKKSTSAMHTIPTVPKSKEGFMTIQGIERHSMTIQAEIKDKAYTTIGAMDVLSATTPDKSCNQQIRDCLQEYKSTVVLTVFTAKVDATVDESLSRELYRCTKKHLPRNLEYSLVYAADDVFEPVHKNEITPHTDMSIFQGFHAGLDGQSLIFIGHATAQRTGIGGHMMSRFIPTVERELIDLGDGATSVWNRDLLHVGGLLCRAIYEWELSDIQRLWTGDGKTNTPGTLASPRDQLHQRFLRILQFFSFCRSTPSEEVSFCLKVSFCQGSSEPLRLLSSHGVLHPSGIKAFDRDFAMFIKHIPMLSETTTAFGARIIEALPSQHRVLQISLEEVFEYLREHSLTSEEMVSCLSWWMRLNDSDQASSKAILLDSATLKGANGSLLHLSSVRYFIDTQGLWASITLDGPLPETLIPYDISKPFTRNALEKLGWKEFTIIAWLEYISDPATMSANPEHDFTKSRDWAEHVLDIIATVWPSLSDGVRLDVKAVLGTMHCIPTAECLSLPINSFLPDVNHHLSGNFHSPVVQFNEVPIDARISSFLSFIGVQEHTPLELLLEKQVDTGLWSIYELVHYLVQLSPAIKEEYFLKLRERGIFPMEGTLESAEEGKCHRADELHPPSKEFRKLELKIIEWGQPEWLEQSVEVDFMYRLGLRRYPALETIIERCSSQGEVAVTAFKYLCTNLSSGNLNLRPENFRGQAFIPGEVEGEDKTSLKKPGEVFLDAEWKKLGFAVVPASYRDMPLSCLGVQRDPPTSKLINSLPPKKETALKWLEMLSRHISNFVQDEFKQLSVLDIVPIGPAGNPTLRPPKKCYLGKPSSDGFYPSLFDFVDFDPDVTRFLRACDAKDGPSVTDIAEALIVNPEQFYDLAGKDRFLAELRQLSHHNKHFPCDTMDKLSQKPTLLGEKRVKAEGQGWKYIYELRKPEDIVVVDDDADYQLFSDCIFVAPRDDELLRGFYESLGCEQLSKLVHVQRHADLEETLDPETWNRNEICDLVRQRLPLFLQKCTYARPNIGWLDGLTVRVWKTLSARKVLHVRKRDPIIRQQDVWAITEYGDSRQVELWLSASAPRDMYQLASCLCRRLFQTAKDKDTFFLESIISADPEVLEGRGFIVEPPPQQVKQATKLVSNKGKMRQGAPGVTPSDPTTSFGRSNTNLPESGGVIAGIMTRSLHTLGDTISGVFREGVMHWKPKNPAQMITRDDIRTTITAAVAASHAGNGKSLDGSLATTQFQSNYCEIERPGEDLRFCRQVAGIKIYLPEGGYRMDLARHEALARFIQILVPIAEVYGLSNESLHIFSDNASGRIAFNRGGCLYVNLLHFEKSHDQAVANGNRLQCQISWFLTLAHEIAHNISRFHNAEHEFWFSEICEAYFVTFVRDILANDSRSLG